MSDTDGPAALLLREPAHRVSPRAKLMWLCSEVLTGAASSAAVIFVHSRHWVPGPWDLVLLVLVIGEALLSALVVPFWRYYVHRWEITDEAVYTQRGWFNQERRVAPIPRIQTVDTERGPLAQLFGLSTVTITTASSKGALRIDGLDRAQADQIAQRLTTIAAADGGDGT